MACLEGVRMGMWCTGVRRTDVRVALVAGWLAVAGGLASAAPLVAQTSLSTRVDTTRITVGDRLSLEVTVEHPGDAVVSWPDSVDVAPFELLGVRIAPMRTQDGRAASTAAFSLTAFELGELELPSFPVSVLHPDGREETLATDAYGIEVVSVGVDETGDIREIRGPLGIPVGLLSILSLVLLLLLLVAAAWIAWKRLRKADDEGSALPPPPPPRPPHEVALEALAALEDGPLLREGRVKDFHIRVSEILRRYVEARYRVPALEMTTWEIMGGLESAGVAEGVRADLRRFLDQCDMVKFAKVRPAEDASRAVLELGREIVERSAPEER